MRNATKHADVAAAIQHADTVAAIQRADDANNNARETSTQQARDTKTSLDLTKKAADAAKRSADIAEAGVRAWVAPINFVFANLSDPDNPLKVRILYQNVGREPAIGVKIATRLLTLRNVTLLHNHWTDLPNWKDRALSSKDPSLTFENSIDTGVWNIEEISPDAATEIKSLHAVFILRGCFSYETVGVRKNSSFCVFLNPAAGGKDISEWHFSACPAGNDEY